MLKLLPCVHRDPCYWFPMAPTGPGILRALNFLTFKKCMLYMMLKTGLKMFIFPPKDMITDQTNDFRFTTFLPITWGCTVAGYPIITDMMKVL